jgi:ABC-type dipeptide/oligopeptide/nickel transport system permease subunit
MLSDGTKNFTVYPYLLLFPGLIIGITVFAINLIGDGVRDAMDPKLRN